MYELDTLWCGMKYIVAFFLFVCFCGVALAGLLIWILFSTYTKEKKTRKNDEYKDWAFWMFLGMACLAAFILFVLYLAGPILMGINAYGH